MRKDEDPECASAAMAAFLAACEAGDIETVRELSTRIGDVDSTDASGRTGLMAAASRNRTAVMTLLLQQGADPDKANANGTTPLMFAKTAAFAYGDCAGMKVLLDAGADRDARDRKGLTALDYTISRAALVRNFLETYRE